MIIIDKPEGITPIDFWKQYRAEHLTNETRGGICGKLDPMASGKMLVLLDDECKQMGDYLKMDKEYTFDIIIGLSTDTDDILGMLNPIKPVADMDLAIAKVMHALVDYKSTTVQKFHHFSAIHVSGVADEKSETVNRPLWWWAKNGLLDKVEVPEKAIKITKMTIGEETQFLTLDKFVNTTLNRLDKVHIEGAKFRLSDIIGKWEEVKDDTTQLVRISVNVHVSTGTYVRQIVKDISGITGIPLLCDKICRTKLYI